MAGNQIKRKLILSAAERIMSRKGKDAKISEIAKEAGVFDSNIYHYFKNKEDLLFSVAEERTRQSLEDLKLQLQGIREPVSKLSKLIWWQLYRQHTQKEFSSIVLFHCRSRSGFYKHRAFEQILMIRQILDSIIDEGIEKGVFHRSVNKPAMWSIIFGVTDLESILSLSAQETDHTLDDLDHILNLILPMMTVRPDKGDKKLDKLDRIRQAAERVFAEKGYDSATIQDIAGMAEVADGTIYDYFTNKEDLLFSSIKAGFGLSSRPHRFSDHLFSTERDLELKSPLDKIKRFIRYFFYLGLIRPDFTKTFVLHGIYNQQFYQSKAFTAFKRYLETLFPLLDQGKKEGSIRPEVNNRVFRNLLLGGFSINALRWFLSDKRAQLDKEKEILQMIDLYTRSIMVDNTSPAV